MQKFKIFISAVQKELRAERRAVKDLVLGDSLLSEYFDVFLFEDAPAKSKSAEKAFLEEVRKSDIYIGILGDKYGAIGKGKVSATESEFREAKRQPKDILIHNLADYAQRAGSGTLEMIEQCRNQGAPEPEFVLIRNVEFRSILPRDIFTEEVLNRLGLNGRQLKAIKFVKEKGRITSEDYQLFIGGDSWLMRMNCAYCAVNAHDLCRPELKRR